ncbi:DEAD/DEAH box helicase family protein [Treponema phagedenis]|uniref:Type III restriction endonuclease subunit R n=1 Tax=Treponema phagedenis TaxID=162 RepID=A0AAE6IU09_TREPH|nr:DEAD/DEAH box helicase family protein [Treponema phagedenis]QEJ94957.1 type III restriction endonuclease subunit R [Treponema phagedenis]QEJ98314.1 type III restriction endonuclease subunit R [Treponema phagedenis]QEK00860.1 type III restriction endonuclease subunit R [Treponema phagedenis]QEK03824.1 type III restriction endonuclease subunit R [Treponema phagedenis]QEK05867.1 type III restriction endonuclease subunit R [Treponema phagedenis]
MSKKIQHYINGRLSLRAPQVESLATLKQALDTAPEILEQQRDITTILEKLKAAFPALQHFEREFPSLCFALATGVGKTRLMGAFITYLHLAHGIHNFFVLAPNLTIYDKLITDFSSNTPKYVFKGIGEFSINPPRVITGDNYLRQDIYSGNLFSPVQINIFNISKINSEIRGSKEPRIKRMQEVLGDSYFNYLAHLHDLVLLMDESHRYRAQAGMRAINELNPLLGLELTATPFVESSKEPIPFKNVVVNYPLARAIEDGFVKIPAVVTQRNFDAKNYEPTEIEKIKLEDGIRVHEHTKAELMTYAHSNALPAVKPFMLVIARDTTHAAQLLALLESDAFYSGRYRGKVIQVDSSRTGKDEEEMISRLLAVESVDEPTEIVIHVNMLKEGWDVTNLYTIVPLRAANARTLIEQSIGRGLRLPYGKRTGVEVVDRLNIIAHDRFQEIIDEANRGDSVLRLKQIILDAPSDDDSTISVEISSNIENSLSFVNRLNEKEQAGISQSITYQPVFHTETEKHIAQAVMEEAVKYEANPDKTPTSRALLQPEIQAQIIEKIQKQHPPQSALALDSASDIAEVVAKATQLIVDQTIDIPRIIVQPVGEVTTGFNHFTIDELPHFQPGHREILGQQLTEDNRQFTLSRQTGIREKRLEDYIVKKLMDFDDIDYFTQADFLYDLSAQAVRYYQTQKYSEDELHEIFDTYGAQLAQVIHAQMMEHFWEKAASYETKISRGFTALKPCHYTTVSDGKIYSIRETPQDLSRMKQLLFGYFKKCLYPVQKFDSDTERRFAIILERDAQKWFKPVKGQFMIYYKFGVNVNEYIPDFVVETDDVILMAETKARTDISSPEVTAKAEAAVTWCRHASGYTQQHNGKPWLYLLIPHDEVTEAKRLEDFFRLQIT